jgi:hypothetical protein
VNLYSVTVRADIEFAKKWRADNTLILCDENADQAGERATNFFIANGLYVKTPVAGTTPRLVDVTEIPLTAMVYNGKLVENPDKYLKRVPQDSTNLQETIGRMSSNEIKTRCEIDPEFRELVDTFRKK